MKGFQRVGDCRHQVEMQSGETLSASIKVAVVLKHAPPRLREVVRVLQIDCRDYPKLREVLKQYLQSGRQFNGDGLSVEQTPMEIDYLSRGPLSKGKGKGKQGAGVGKGAISGKSWPGPQFGQSTAVSSTEARSCHTCGKDGHLAKNCPQNNHPPQDRSSTETGSCHTCGKVGHLAKNCFQNTHPPQKGKGKGKGGKRGVLSIEDGAPEEEMEVSGACGKSCV